MKAVIYARYSCDNQREESIEGQLRECKAFAERKEFTLIGSYIDRAVSAKTDNRPEFQKMIKDSAKGVFDVIIVWKLDRFARNRYDSAHYKTLLRKNGVKVISATEAISEGAEGIILESVLEGYAEYYSAELSEKVIRGMTENALKCKYNGGYVPIGYKIDENKCYQIDELAAPVIREVFLMYINGRQTKDIVKFINDKGITTSRKKPFTQTTISKVLQNRKYIGEYQYRDVVIPNGLPAIISKELFDMAQTRLEKNRHAPAAMKADKKYILSAKMICSDCGSYMVGECGISGAKKKKYYYYKCSGAKNKKNCHRKAVRKFETEEKIINSIFENIWNTDVIEEIANHVIAWQKHDNTVIPLLCKELNNIEKSIDNVMTAIEKGIITPTTKKRLNELETIKADIEIKIAKEEIQDQTLTKEHIIYWLTNMKKLDLMNEDNKQIIIDTFINSIYVYDDKMVVNFNCREGSETIPLELMSVSSDLLMLGSPA